MKWRAISDARQEAAIVLDAWIEGRPELQKRVPHLVKLAVTEYALKRKLDTLRYYPWREVTREREVDIYCLLCGEFIGVMMCWQMRMLRADIKAGYFPAVVAIDMSPAVTRQHVLRHSVACALQCLAGLRTPVELPSADVASATAADPNAL